MNNIILSGDLYYANLNPVIGSEQEGTRPVLGIQNNTGNWHSPTVIVAAVTGKTKPKLPTYIALSGLFCLEQDSMVLLEQLRTIDKWRLGDYIGKVNKALMEEVNHGLAVSIGLNHLINEPLTLCLWTPGKSPANNWRSKISCKRKCFFNRAINEFR